MTSQYPALHLDEYELQPVFGCSLEDHLRIQDREIAFVIEECVTFLYREAMGVQVSPLYCNWGVKIPYLSYPFCLGHPS